MLPLIRLGQNAGTTEVSAIDPGHALDFFKTPLAGFENGSREFALFYLSKPLACRGDRDCGSGLVCDAGLGYAGERPDEPRGLTLPCVDGSAGCSAETLPADAKQDAASGFCAARAADRSAASSRVRSGST